MKTILVTGGAGYIGSHTVVELLEKNYDVIIVDNFSNSNPIMMNKLHQLTGKSVKIYTKDCREQLDDILSHYKIDGVIHFAAYKSVGESVEIPINYYDNNINSLLNIIDACKTFDIKNIVFSSSCSLYGNVDSSSYKFPGQIFGPVNEDTPLSDPQSPYAFTKLVGERILSDFCKVNKDINGISLRYFNPVGAHESGLIGELPLDKPNNIMPVLCNSVDDEEMMVFGEDYETRDGSCIRDYVHVSDIASAHVLALEYMMSGPDKNYDVFNLGSESGVSVLELIKTFEEVNNVKVNYKISGRREGDVVQIYSDSTKAKSLLGWEPKYDIKDMVSSAWKWHNNNKTTNVI